MKKVLQLLRRFKGSIFHSITAVILAFIAAILVLFCFNLLTKESSKPIDAENNNSVVSAVNQQEEVAQ